MIYHDRPTGQKSSFEELLNNTKIAVVEALRFANNAGQMTGDNFESLTFEKMCSCARGTEFEDGLIHTNDREFPDIVAAGYFGVEVKATVKDAWTSIGNSVLESSRVMTVEKIYIFFGKLGGMPDVEYRNYEDCMKGIAVTHYPRYQIDMHLAKGESIFDLMKVDYDTMRTSDNPVAHVRRYYKSQMHHGDGLWWIDDGHDSIPTLGPIIRNYATLDLATKDRIKAELFILYPEILSRSTNKFKKVPAYLAARHGVVTANVRDIFSAGGQVVVRAINGEQHRVPKVIGELARLAPLIEELLEKHTLDELNNSWGRHVDDAAAIRSEWFYEINRSSSLLGLRARASDFYEAGLSR